MMRWNWRQPPIISGRYSDSLLHFAAKDFLTAFENRPLLMLKGEECELREVESSLHIQELVIHFQDPLEILLRSFQFTLFKLT